jgi:phenylalanyl-tRNA synthetase beta chain
VVADVLGSLERPRVAWGPAESAAFMQPGRALVATYPSGAVAATLGAVRQDVLAQLGLKAGLHSDVAVGEISIDTILAAPRETRRYAPLPRFPGIKVDVAIAVPIAVRSAQVVEVIEVAAGPVCRDVDLFDLYTGSAVGEGRKSLAYHVLLQADDKTLGESEERKFLERLAGTLGVIGGVLRDG